MTNHFDDNMQSPICLGSWKLHTRHIIPNLFRYETFINALNNYGPRAEPDVLFGLFCLSGSQGPWWAMMTACSKKKYFPQIREYTRYMTQYSQEKNIKKLPEGPWWYHVHLLLKKKKNVPEYEKNCGSLSKYMIWMKKKMNTWNQQKKAQ